MHTTIHAWTYHSLIHKVLSVQNLLLDVQHTPRAGPELRLQTHTHTHKVSVPAPEVLSLVALTLAVLKVPMFCSLISLDFILTLCNWSTLKKRRNKPYMDGRKWGECCTHNHSSRNKQKPHKTTSNSNSSILLAGYVVRLLQRSRVSLAKQSCWTSPGPTVSAKVGAPVKDWRIPT